MISSDIRSEILFYGDASENGASMCSELNFSLRKYGLAIVTQQLQERVCLVLSGSKRTSLKPLSNFIIQSSQLIRIQVFVFVCFLF